jgi:hypothetical protein
VGRTGPEPAPQHRRERAEAGKHRGSRGEVGN